MPPPLRERAAAITPRSLRRDARDLPADCSRKWPWDRDRLRARARRRPSRITAPTSSSSAAATSPRSTASACTCTWRNRRCRRSSASSATARRSSAICTSSACSAPNFTAAHAIWLDDDDIGRLADAGASVAHNPGSNLKLGSGLAATRKHARPRRHLRHRHRRLPVVRQPQHVRGHAHRRVRLARAGARSAPMAQRRRGVRGRDRSAARARSAWSAASDGSRPATRPTWSFSTSPASTTCR